MPEHQIINGPDGKPAYAVIPWQEYTRMTNAAKMTDEAIYDAAKAAGEESIPMEVADRLLAGENPIKVYREYRGMTQRALAAAISVTTMYVSQIETGKRFPSRKLLPRIATALTVNPDDLSL